MSIQWIEFAQAVALLDKKYRGAEQAAQALYEKLATGAIRSIAGEITRFENCDTLGGGGRPAAHREQWRIPSRLWGHASLNPLFGGDWQHSSFRATRTDIDWGPVGYSGKRKIDPRIITTSYRIRLVSVDSAQIKALLGVGAVRNAVTYASAQQRAETWLKGKFADPNTVGTAKAEFEASARAVITGLSGRAFDAAWKAAVVEFPIRAKSGRPRRPSSDKNQDA